MLAQHRPKYRLRLGLTSACLAFVWLLGCGSSEPSSPALGASASSGSDESAGARNRGGSGGLDLTRNDAGSNDAGAANDCQRQVTLQAVTLGEPAPFDLVIVADHSMSLTWSRDELAKGLQDLLTHVQGRQVRVFLLTPTQYGASSAAAKKALTGDAVVSWQDPVSGKPFEDAMTEYSQTCTDSAGAAIDCPAPEGPTPYQVHGTWAFAMPEPVATISPDMTDAAFAAQAAAVQSAILAIGGTGSPHEQPLCTLARYVSQPAAKLPKNAVFLLITDEDDESTPDECLQSYESALQVYKTEQSATSCSAGCDAYRYSMLGTNRWLRLPYTCAAFTDTGTRIAGTDRSGWYNLGAVGTCDSITPGPCSDAERASVAAFCDSGLSLVDCTRECASQELPCKVDLPDPGIDACTQSFSYDGQTWPNLEGYCASRGSAWHDCTGGGVNLQYTQNFAGTYSHVNVTGGSTNTADIAAYVKNTAATAFAAGGYLLEGIVFEPSFSCALGSGQSYATNLANFIGDPSHLFPLCESYAPALDGVVDFAQTLVQTQFALALQSDEHITRVTVVAKDQSERRLTDQDYHFAAGTLELEAAAIRASDVNLRVEITSDCRPVIR